MELGNHARCSIPPTAHVLGQPFSTGVPPEFLKHAVPGSLVSSTGLSSLRLSNTKKANLTVALQCECSVLNHKYIGHLMELCLIGQVANKDLSDWLILSTRNPY